MTSKAKIIQRFVNNCVAINLITASQKERLAMIVEASINAAIEDFKQTETSKKAPKKILKISKSNGYFLDRTEYDELVQFLGEKIDEAAWNAAYLDDYNFRFFYGKKPGDLLKYLESKSGNQYFKFRKNWVQMLVGWRIPDSLSEFGAYIQDLSEA